MTIPTISYVPADATTSVADLLLRISDGDPAAWDELLRRYSKLVSTTVRSFRLQEADALDAIQMTWLRFAENAHRVQFPERLGGWLATTARRECLQILRQAKLRPDFTDMMMNETVSEPSAGPEQHAIDTHNTRTLRKLIDELSPRQRTLPMGAVHRRSLLLRRGRPHRRNPARRNRAHPSAGPTTAAGQARPIPARTPRLTTTNVKLPPDATARRALGRGTVTRPTFVMLPRQTKAIHPTTVLQLVSYPYVVGNDSGNRHPRHPRRRPTPPSPPATMPSSAAHGAVAENDMGPKLTPVAARHSPRGGTWV
jgi:RNA polymerase sigma factor (sigma-70 family)